MAHTEIQYTKDSKEHQVRKRSWTRKSDGVAFDSYLIVAPDKRGFIHHNIVEDKHYGEAVRIKKSSGGSYRVRSFSQYHPEAEAQKLMEKFVNKNEQSVVFSEVQKLLSSGNQEKALDMYSLLIEDLSGDPFIYECIEEGKEDEVLDALNLGYFIPQENHDIGDGGWVMVVNHPKIKPAIMYAKRTHRTNVDHIINKFPLIELMEDSIHESVNKNAELVEAKRKLKFLLGKQKRAAAEFVTEFSLEIQCKPYEILVQTHTRNGKPKKVYLTPGQYFVVKDIETYLDYIYKGGKELVIHTLSNHEMDDRIFYLQSRGISKDKAMILCNLTNTYFDIPEEIFKLYEKRFKENSKVKF